MTHEEAITRHASEIEYLRTIARGTAVGLIASLTVDDLKDPDEGGTLADKVALAVSAFVWQAAEAADAYSVAMGYGSLGDLTAFVEQTGRDVVDQTRGALSDAISAVEKRIKDSLAAGVDERVLSAAITNDAGSAALTAGLRAALAAEAAAAITAVDRAVTDAAVAGVAERSGADPQTMQMLWQTVGDDRVCFGSFENSCEGRHGTVQPMSEWKKAGLPGAPQLICSIFSRTGVSQCRCALLPAVPGVSPAPSRINIGAAVGAARARGEAAVSGLSTAGTN